MPAGDTAPASALAEANGTSSSSSEVRLEFEVEAPLPPAPPSPPRGGGKKAKANNSTDESASETEPEPETDDDGGSDGSPRYAPALGAALARFEDLPRDRVAIGLARGINGSSSNGNSPAGKCGARSQSKKAKKARKRGACSSFEATMELNDGEEADNVRQAFANGDVSGFVEYLRRATTLPGLPPPTTGSNNNNSSIASVESVSSKASTSTSSAVLVEPAPYNVVFTSISGTLLAVATSGREVVTDGSAQEKQPLGEARSPGSSSGFWSGSRRCLLCRWPRWRRCGGGGRSGRLRQRGPAVVVVVGLWRDNFCFFMEAELPPESTPREERGAASLARALRKRLL